ncbi:MAG: hypothetical protein COA40_02180 [Aequorivita sp.]|nr:MAG: hypothetical protein COA40_02180 [Aequorivita sp.]
MELLTKFIDDAEIADEEFFTYVQEADNDELAEFVSVFNDVIDSSYSEEKNNDKFNFIANSTLSGLSFPCGEIDCKINSIYSLARNAILYADTVYLQNPFEQYLNYKEFNDKLRQDLIGDLIVLSYIRPLLEERIFKIAVSKVHYCHDCYTRFQENYLQPFDWNLKTIEPLITDYLIKNIDFHLHWDYDNIGVEISGNNDLLNHPMVVNFLTHVPKNLENKAKKGERIKLRDAEIKDSGVTYFLMNEIERNLSIQDFYSTYYSCHVLTDREFDIKLLKLINKDIYEQNARQGEIIKNLNHLVPFIDEVPIKKLIKLRKKEGESFQVYRDKINNLSKSNLLTMQDSKQIYQDEIRPELNKINLTLKNNKKVLWGNIKSNVFLASTYISTSLFTGILPTNIDKIVASVGGFGFAKNIGQDVLKLIKKPEVRNNELYFLWKIKQDNKIEI